MLSKMGRDSEVQPRTTENDPTKIHPIVRFWVREWRVVKTASFWIAILLIGTLIYKSAELLYAAQIKALEATIKTTETDRDSFRQKWDDEKKALDAEKTSAGTASKIDSPTQCFLKLLSIQVLADDNSVSSYDIPFRIEALVDNANYSFPSSLVFLKGRNIMYLDDVVPLPVGESKFNVRFVAIIPKTPRSRSPATNVLQSVSSESKSFSVAGLPSREVARVSMPDAAPPQDSPPAIIEITYEIFKR